MMGPGTQPSTQHALLGCHTTTRSNRAARLPDWPHLTAPPSPASVTAPCTFTVLLCAEPYPCRSRVGQTPTPSHCDSTLRPSQAAGGPRTPGRRVQPVCCTPQHVHTERDAHPTLDCTDARHHCCPPSTKIASLPVLRENAVNTCLNLQRCT